MNENMPTRKNIRLKNYDYNSVGAYFITICTKNREEILSTVGTGVLDGPFAGVIDGLSIVNRNSSINLI